MAHNKMQLSLEGVPFLQKHTQARTQTHLTVLLGPMCALEPYSERTDSKLIVLSKYCVKCFTSSCHYHLTIVEKKLKTKKTLK